MCCQQQQLHVQLGFSKYRLPRMRPEQREKAVLLSQDSVGWSHIAFNNLDATLQVNRADIRQAENKKTQSSKAPRGPACSHHECHGVGEGSVDRREQHWSSLVVISHLSVTSITF